MQNTIIIFLLHRLIVSLFNLDCTGKNFTLRFDKIHLGNDDKFIEVKSIIDNFIAGGISCVVNYGTTGSGKTTTMFGIDGDSFGLLRQAGEYILKSTSFKVSAFECIGDACFDLLNHVTQLDEKHSHQSQVLISLEDKFKDVVGKIYNSRKQKSTSQNGNSSRSHLFVVFEIENPPSKIAFVDLAGFESLENEESRHINKTLSELNVLLINATKNKCVVPQKSNKMAWNLKPYLLPPCQTIFLVHINNLAAKKGLEMVKDFVSSTSGLKRRLGDPLEDITNAKLNR